MVWSRFAIFARSVVQAEYSESDGENTSIFIFKKLWPVKLIVYFFEISIKVPISATIIICKLQTSSRLLRNWRT